MMNEITIRELFRMLHLVVVAFMLHLVDGASTVTTSSPILPKGRVLVVLPSLDAKANYRIFLQAIEEETTEVTGGVCLGLRHAKYYYSL